jgi:MFS family permease
MATMWINVVIDRTIGMARSEGLSREGNHEFVLSQPPSLSAAASVRSFVIPCSLFPVRYLLFSNRPDALNSAPSPMPIPSSSEFRPRRKWPQAVAALRYPNYRLWFFGQLISLFGTWMQSTALGYLVFQLTRSPAYLGYVSAAMGLPSWLFTPYGGVVADRISVRILLLLTQAAMMVLAVIIAILTFGQWIRPWQIIVLSVGMGVATAFDAPARQSFVLELVDREDLSNTIAFNAIMFNLATTTGPTLGGLVYEFWGPSWCFSINALSYLAVIGALLIMRLRPPAPRPAKRSAWTELREGLGYVRSHTLIRALLGLMAVVSVFAQSFVTLLPAWSVTVLHGNATTNGLLQSARGAGALLAAFSIAALGRFQFKGALLTWGSFALPLALLGFSQTRQLSLAMIVMFGVGVALVLIMNMANTLVQTLTADHLRGRVMSLFTLTFFGFIPLGAFLCGILAEHMGEPLTIAAGALVTLIFVLLLRLMLPSLRALN